MTLLMACAPVTPPGIAAQAVYIAADQEHMEVLTWENVGGTLQGEWIQRQMPDLSLLLPHPPSQFSWSGQVQDPSSFTLAVEGSVLKATIVDGQRLEIIGILQGYVQHTLWYQSTQEQANHIMQAFDAYAQAQLAFATLKTTLTSPPLDSQEASYAQSVHIAEQYVQGLREKHTTLASMDVICGTVALAQFRLVYPPDPSEFTVSSREQAGASARENAERVVSQTTLFQQLQRARNARAQALQRDVPAITASLSLVWKTLPDAGVERRGDSMLSHLEQAVETDITTMQQLKEEASRIASDIEYKAGRQGCPRLSS